MAILLFFILYFLAGSYALRMELQKDYIDRVQLVMDRKYKNYLIFILIWPLILLGPKLVHWAKQRSFDAEHVRKVQSLNEEQKGFQITFKKMYSKDQRVAILCAFHYIATTDFENTNEYLKYMEYIENTSLFYDIPYNYNKFDLLLETKYSNLSFIKILDNMPSKEAFSLNMYALLCCSKAVNGKLNMNKMNLALSLLQRIGIDNNKWNEIVFKKLGHYLFS